VEKKIDNEGMEWRLSSISFGRFESSRGEGLSGRRILGWKRYKPKYPMEKQVKLVVLYCSSKQEYISARKNIVNCRNNHPKYERINGQ
jgi:hypothetical protein